MANENDRIPDLKSGFYDCVAEINSECRGTDMMFVFFETVEYYTESHRRFHTLEHIESGLDLLKEVNDSCENYYLVQFAWWHHDCVYIPAFEHNESVSAERAFFNALQLGFSKEDAKKISLLVMATDNKNGVVRSKDQEIIHDIDLAVLGSEPDEYKKYSGQIREEYSVYQDGYKKRRLGVLQDLLDSEFIYYTKSFRDRFEKKAEENILNEIEGLIGT